MLPSRKSSAVDSPPSLRVDDDDDDDDDDDAAADDDPPAIRISSSSTRVSDSPSSYAMSKVRDQGSISPRGGDKDRTSVSRRIEEGAKVEANYRGKGKWYPGKIKG